MKTRQFGFAATVIALGTVAMSTACGENPKPKCVTGRGEFAARYTYVSGPESCKARRGEVLGIQSYNKKGENGAPDLDKVPIAIQSSRVANLQARGDGDPSPTHKLYAEGIFKTAEPDDNDLCVADMTSVEEQDIPKLDPVEADIDADAKTCSAAAELAFPATNVKYEWSGVTFYVTAASAGTQFKARLKYTEKAETESVCEWDVQGVYPSVSCGVTVGSNADNVVDSKDNPTCRVTTKTDSICASSAPPDFIYGNPVGSSINPDFQTSCEQFDDVLLHVLPSAGAVGQPTQFVCLPTAGKFPALK